MATFSNTGPNIDVVAPGLGIVTTNYTQFGSLISVDGTSVASPLVAGIASLLKGYNTNLYNDDIEEMIKRSADQNSSGTQGVRNDQYGFGRINAQKALGYLISPYVIQHLTTKGGSIYTTQPSRLLIVLGALGLSDWLYRLTKVEIRTTVNLPTNYNSITGV